MKRLYGLQTDKENVILSINEDKAKLTIETADTIKVRELDLQSDVKPDESVSLEADKITTGTRDAGKVKVVNLDGTGEKYYTEESDALAEVEPIDITEYYKDETQQKEQPEPVQRALKRIKELKHITDVRIDEEFKATDFNMTENRLTITIDYLENND